MCLHSNCLVEHVRVRLKTAMNTTFNFRHAPTTCVVFGSSFAIRNETPEMWSLSAHYLTNPIHQKGTPHTSNPLDQADKPRQITYVTMTNERWEWMARGRVGPNPDSLQWNEYKTELYPVPNLWLMDPSKSGTDRWSLLTARPPLWEIPMHCVRQENFIFGDYVGMILLSTKVLYHTQPSKVVFG
jgi:hypothetical protein